MTLAERSERDALRELVRKLFDECARLERERDEAREIVRRFEWAGATKAVVDRWDAEDAQAGAGGKETP